MKKIHFIIFLLLALSCKTQNPDKKISVIPQPVSIEKTNSSFELNENTVIVFENSDDGFEKTALYLQTEINKMHHLKLKVMTSGNHPSKNTIQLLLDTKTDYGNEGYAFVSNKNNVQITSHTAQGSFYGVQTLLQLIDIEKADSVFEYTTSVAGVKIFDKPAFAYRGMHLDVCRHFYDKEFVKKYIDLLAMHKMNTFHWHLTEDQGWRIEIKKYPRLTEIGSYRSETMLGKNWDQFDGVPHSGYYTQEDIKEIVQYAEERFITIIPEIEMPGHSLAALAAYPEFGCTGGPYEVAKTWGVFEDVYCAGNDNTFQFLEDVLTEVIELFPGKYIHIGGDECPKKQWEKCSKCQQRIKVEGLANEMELQSYFIKRIEKFLLANNKKLIGWDEILEGGLAPEATVMSWRGTEGGIEAARSGHDVIMCPNSDCYFDHYQADPANEPLAIGGMTTLEDVYNYFPIPEELNPEEAKHILGAQANLWTEYISTPEHVEYMVLPRMCALSEVVWLGKQNRSFDGFKLRLKKHLYRLGSQNYNFRMPD